MGKKMKKFPFLSETAAATWRRWPACTSTPKTLSFRENIEKATDHQHLVSDLSSSDDDDDVVFDGLRSERLFYEPGKTNSILEEAKSRRGVEMVTIESKDPVFDFRVSMEEMVEANGLRDLTSFAKLLSYYLKVNVQENYEYIFEAFLGLLKDQFFSGLDESSCSFTCTTSADSFASPCLSNEGDEIVNVEKIKSV